LVAVREVDGGTNNEDGVGVTAQIGESGPIACYVLNSHCPFNVLEVDLPRNWVDRNRMHLNLQVRSALVECRVR
jgi:hypothetical protein